MTLIKKIIYWLIELIRSLFHKKKKKKNSKESYSGDINNKNKKAASNFKIDVELPNYMIISDHDREKLIYNLNLMKDYLLEENSKISDKECMDFIKNLSSKYDIKIEKIVDNKDLELKIKDVPVEEKKELLNQYDRIIDKEKNFKIHVNEVEKIIDEVKKRKVSIVLENAIENEISNITNDKNIGSDTLLKVDNFNKNILEMIGNIDNFFLSDVIKEYNKVNYVTISTKIIDNNYQKLNIIQEDLKKHRYNKYYYEREINKIKRELKQIQNLKNKKEVSEHIGKLKKELYTKNKDKYDLLYNNEIFMNLNKECDILLDKVNTKVIDIKKEKIEQERQEENRKKKEYIDNILLRFKDLALARRIIIESQENDQRELSNNEYEFVINSYKKFNNGLEEDFNFIRNKKKTELVILFNELNMAINKKNNKPYISINHINYQMKDLEEAVDVKKKEIKKIYNIDSMDYEPKTDNKVKKLVYNPKENNNGGNNGTKK